MISKSKIIGNPRQSCVTKKLAECDAVWDARSHKERAVRNMFVVDDAEPGEILLRCRGTVQAVAWKIWDASRNERQQRRGF